MSVDKVENLTQDIREISVAIVELQRKQRALISERVALVDALNLQKTDERIKARESSKSQQSQ